MKKPMRPARVGARAYNHSIPCGFQGPIDLHAPGAAVVIHSESRMMAALAHGLDRRLVNRPMDERPDTETQPDLSSREALEEQFVQLYMRRVFVVIYRIVGNVSDAQDLTQETFIKALQRREQLKDLEKAGHWLSRIASNTAIDFLRKRNRQNWTPLEDVAGALSMPGEAGPEAQLLAGEQKSLLDEGLSKLTERERTALVLRDIEDLPAEEVAQRLNCGKATVRSHIANARVKFKRYLERRQP
jgi:RNA polymerase sigma-70 factor (ECF subfamily)